MPQPTDAASLFASILELKFNAEGAHKNFEYKVEVKAGNKFDKIFISSGLKGSKLHTSIHAFVERATGSVYKAAGLTQPAKGVRFSNVVAAAEVADPYGSYLYA